MLSMNRTAVALTDLIIETFRLNGRLLSAGDALVSSLGLTSARWQVLGAIALSPVPLTISQIARNMGLTRQSVQRLVNEMRRDALLRLKTNPHHRRAMLVEYTARGRSAYEAALERQEPWVAYLAKGCRTEQIASAVTVLRMLRGRLDDDGPTHEE
jgi:DNA-binding MarR family transcriptional regulator